MRRHLRLLRNCGAFTALLLLGLSQVGCREEKPIVPEKPTEAEVVAPIPESTPLVALPAKAPISQAAIDLIVNAETGGKSEYEKLLIHPDWPGAQSGVTVGVGYDCGQTSRYNVLSDWLPLRDDWRTDLADTSGIIGERARPVAKGLSYISIGWTLSNEVFFNSTLPQYWELTERTFPGVDELCPNAAGALTSLVYNRGSSMVGDSRREMRAIRDLVPLKDYSGIAQQIRSMKRLWYGRGLDGLLKRRDAEADLVLTCAK